MARTTPASATPVEWRTVTVAVVIHGAWLTLVLGHDVAPGWVTAVLLGVVLAWHGSLQHELVHGHPFPSRRANDALGSLPLSPRVPYQAYRRYHLHHHACDDLTDPTDDVESYYLSSETWDRRTLPGRWFAIAHQTLLGRLVLGPPCEILRVWRWQLREAIRGDRDLARSWIEHVVLLTILAVFVFTVVGMSPWIYGAGVYLGHSLSLVRSFAEHRWVDEPMNRSAVVQSGRFFSLLFLNNNLHHTHHEHPGVAWYRLPALATEIGSAATSADGAGFYPGYLDIARRYGVRPIDQPLHPPHRAAVTGSAS